MLGFVDVLDITGYIIHSWDQYARSLSSGKDLLSMINCFPFLSLALFLLLLLFCLLFLIPSPLILLLYTQQRYEKNEIIREKSSLILQYPMFLVSRRYLLIHLLCFHSCTYVSSTT